MVKYILVMDFDAYANTLFSFLSDPKIERLHHLAICNSPHFKHINDLIAMTRETIALQCQPLMSATLTDREHSNIEAAFLKLADILRMLLSLYKYHLVFLHFKSPSPSQGAIHVGTQSTNGVSTGVSIQSTSNGSDVFSPGKMSIGQLRGLPTIPPAAPGRSLSGGNIAGGGSMPVSGGSAIPRSSMLTGACVMAPPATGMTMSDAVHVTAAVSMPQSSSSVKMEAGSEGNVYACP